MAELVALAIGILGVASVVLAAMRWRRDDTTQVVTQQSAILNDMHVLNDEIRVSAENLRSERDKCFEEVAKLRELTQRIDDKLRDQQLLDELGRKPLDYSRRRFLGTWLALGVLAIMTAIALISAGRTAETNLEQTDDIARVADQTADSAQQSTDQVVSFLRGEQGIPGVPGADGQDGTPGQPGTGTGDAGPKGDQGEPGTQGPPGAAGGAGTAGAMGQPGSIGLTGTVGPRGPAGEQGAAGPKGDPGSNGKEGAAGPPGPQGAQGAQGPPGLTPPLNTSTTVQASANDTTAHKVVTASCPAGKVTGGGFAVVPSDPGIIVTASNPVGTTGWSTTADVLSLPAGTTWQLLAIATCIT